MLSGGEETLFTHGLDYIPRPSTQKCDFLFNHCIFWADCPICQSVNHTHKKLILITLLFKLINTT